MKKLSISKYEPEFKTLPPEFDGFTAGHISDLHNANFGSAIESQLSKIKPDIIVLTGDIISFESRYANAVTLAENCAKIAPTFFVNGNHEGRFRKYSAYTDRLKEAGVIILENQTYKLTRGQSSVTLIGINDPKFFSGKKKNEFKKKLKDICLSVNGEFSVLLTHRPEFFEFYAECGIMLTFSGHAHGGQIRLPKIGPLYAPGQGFFPKYSSGLCQIGDSYMAVSRGLGHTFRTPPRIFNKRELVFVTLKNIGVANDTANQFD